MTFCIYTAYYQAALCKRYMFENVFGTSWCLEIYLKVGLYTRT